MTNADALAPAEYPGTPHHQRVLAAIVAHYRDDPRVLAVLLFGSLARGNWRPTSDLDLDVVLTDDTPIDTRAELLALTQALAALGESAVAVVPRGDGNGDVVLASLFQFSIRYHHLATTSPNIVDSLRLLAGRIPLETVIAAGEANREAFTWDAEAHLGYVLRALVEASAALDRERLWFASEMLLRVRDGLIEAYGYARGAVRPLHFFEDHADAETRATVSALLCPVSPAALETALAASITTLRDQTETFFAGTAALTEPQRALLERLAALQAQRQLVSRT